MSPELDDDFMLDPDDIDAALAAAQAAGGDEDGVTIDDDNDEGDDTLDDLDDDVHKEFEDKDSADEKVRKLVAQELAKRDQRTDSERMIDKFVNGATETEKMLVDAFLDADRGTGTTKSDIEKLKAKAAALDAATKARIDAIDADRTKEQAGLFQAPQNVAPFKPTVEDDQRKDFKAVATNAPDAAEAGRRMLKRTLEGWTANEPKLR